MYHKSRSRSKPSNLRSINNSPNSNHQSQTDSNDSSIECPSPSIILSPLLSPDRVDPNEGNHSQSQSRARAEHVDTATYVSSLRPPLSPSDPAHFPYSSHSDRVSSSLTSTHHDQSVQPISPIGLHKRRSKSFHLKPSTQSPSSHSAQPSGSLNLEPVSSSTHLLDFPLGFPQDSTLAPMHEFQSSEHSSSSSQHPPYHPPSLNSLTSVPHSELSGRKTRTKSYRHNDELTFKSIPTLTHGLATSIVPGSLVAPAAITQSQPFHDQGLNYNTHHYSPKSSNSSSAAPQDHPRITLKKNKTLSAAHNIFRNASRRVVNISGSEKVDEILRPQRRRRAHTETFTSNVELDYVGSSPPKILTLQPRSSDSEDDQTVGANLPLNQHVEHSGSTLSRPQLKGKSLLIFGPRHPLRLGLFRLFHSGHIDPFIFILIILDAVVLTIQSSKSVWEHPRPTKGYFHTWEDMTLFILFCVFTVECTARIVVSGLAINSSVSLQSFVDTFVTRGKGLLKFQDRAGNHLPIRNADRINLTRPLYSADQYNVSQPSMAWNQYSSHELIKSIPQTPMTSILSPAPSLHYSPTVKPALIHSSSSVSPATAPLSAHKLQPMRKDSFPISILNGKHFFAQEAAPFRSGIERQQSSLIKQSAYLRHSWNRIDLIAVICFWISFILATTGTEATKQIYLFRALSVLRLIRLLTVTSGTTRILSSLKRASPLLVNVIFFILFAVSLFSIVGVQSFKGSFDRYCVWIDPAGQSNYTFQSQSCGGQYNPVTGIAEGFLQKSTGNFFGNPKGYICPQGQLCMETGNPNNGTQNFDNVAGAAMQVIIIASANTWSNMMYSLMDAEYYVSCAFFVICLLVLNFWLLNILVAVITNTFAEIMDESNNSAFAVNSAPQVLSGEDSPDIHQSGRLRKKDKIGRLRRLNNKLYYPWVLVVLAQFSFQASRSSSNPTWAARLDPIESYFTIVFAGEIVLRLACYLPDSTRQFFQNGSNVADAILAILTSIIQVPFIKRSAVYPWLTIFQISRFYRVIVAFPRTGNLLGRLRGSLNGLVNMILFLLLMIFFSALFAAQLLRGIIPKSDQTEMTFYSMWNSFLAMYQIFSSENWTTVLYSAMAAQEPYGQAFISGIFLALWFLFSDMVLLQMFIAVISEGFAVAEEQKKKEQIRELVNRSKPQSELPLWFKKINPYFRSKSAKSQIADRTITLDGDDIPSETVLPGLKSAMGDFLNSRRFSPEHDQTNVPSSKFRLGRHSFVGRARKAFLLDPLDGHFPDAKSQNSDITPEARTKAEATRQMEFLSMTPSQRQHYCLIAMDEKFEREAKFILDHPSYDQVFWFISQRNPIRKCCQLLVEPSYGNRIFGRPANKIAVNVFKSIVIGTILGSVIVAAIATPVYKQHYFLEHGESIYTWFNLTEVILGLFFVVEFFIKVIADGFIFSPNAYLLNTWNRIDLLVLGTLISDIIASLVFGGLTSRFTRSLKAFRALRMINLTQNMRETFYNVLILGFGSLMDASVLTVMYIVPFAVWGQNLFAGLLYNCNDSSSVISGKTQCVGEYVSAPSSLSGAPPSFNFLMPRAWQNPYVYSFDSFRTAILILFEIISLEGWINVMSSLMSITGKDQQPQQDASQWNAIYTLIYNLFGATVVLTLFLAVIINSFLKRSGAAFLTTEQQQWINLKRWIYRQQPSKRPKDRPQDVIRDWCYKAATQKRGWWSTMMTGLYILHVALLMTAARSNINTPLDLYRNAVFLILATFYLVDVLIALLGLGWISFQQNGWRIYDVIVISGTFGTTIPVVLFHSQTNVTIQLQKFFLVAIAFKLVMKNNALNQLFKTAVASLPSIANLMGLWIVFFLVWGILFVENFSLTRAGPTSLTRYSNYQSFANSLVMLAIQSTGEGWNTFMHDYTVEPPFCISSPNFLFNDCGSATAAYVLFISWNIISMYIILNMFTGLVVDNFAYVFQLMGKVKAIDREEVRKFKDAWTQVDRDRRGYITRHQFIPFFALLTEAFDVSIYPPELKLDNLMDASASLGDEFKKSQLIFSDANPAKVLNVSHLNLKLNQTDWKKVSERKELFNYLYQEALMTEKAGKGISFNRMLLLLAHYKLIEDDQVMQLEELLDRRARKQQIEELVKFEKIQGILRMVVERRRFKKIANLSSNTSHARKSSIMKQKLHYL